MKNIQDHFSSIAPLYRELRITDWEPVSFICKRLQDLPQIRAADIGCGCGRYSLKLFQFLGDRLYLYCIDNNQLMLEQLNAYLTNHAIRKFQIKNGPAYRIPLKSDSLESVFTFNAVHHFKINQFLKEAARTLKEDGYLFIYTRLRSQNRRNIWGRFFPRFIEKETRLYEMDELKQILQQHPDLLLENFQTFRFRRNASMDEVIERARNRHYSTFYLYAEDELKRSIRKFQQHLQLKFIDVNHIKWVDENILLVIRKRAKH